MSKTKVSELSGESLNYAVAMAEGVDVEVHKYHVVTVDEFDPELTSIGYGTKKWESYIHYSPVSDWGLTGKLIDKYGVWLSDGDTEFDGQPFIASIGGAGLCFGECYQTAICRAVVTKEFGEYFDIPDELDGN